MKKKLLALVLATAMTLSLASCGGSKTETPSTGSDNSSASSDNSSDEGATYKAVSYTHLLRTAPANFERADG